MKIARDFFLKIGVGAAKRSADSLLASRYRECAYDALAEWYDYWYDGNWSGDHRFGPSVQSQRPTRREIRPPCRSVKPSPATR